MLPKIAVIGNGYWGKNLVRNFHALGVLKYVCDSRSEALQEARDQFGVDTCSSLKELINDPEIRGVAIAAPAAQHYRLAKEFLLAGKDVGPVLGEMQRVLRPGGRLVLVTMACPDRRLPNGCVL